MAQADARRVPRRTSLHTALFGKDNGGKDPQSRVAGYARLLSHPAYENLLGSEKLMRRLVPVLIVIFLIIVAFARWMSLSTQAEQIRISAETELNLIVELVGDRLATGKFDKLDSAEMNALQNLVADSVSTHYLAGGREIFITDQDGTVIAAAPHEAARLNLSLDQLIDDSLLLTTFGRRANTLEANVSGIGPALAVHRILDRPLGGVTLVQPKAAIFGAWNKAVSLNVTLYVGTSSILLVILYAFFAQAARAQEADEITNLIQNRFDTALARGSAGLWDWDLPRGKIYWSRSMFGMLGMEPSDEMMGFGEVADLVHPDDADLYALANQVLVENRMHIDQAFRMRHADGHWIWLRARAQVVKNAHGEPHLIGITVDITEEQNLKQHSRKQDMRLNDAIENLSEAFVLWDSDKRLVMCNSKYQQLHGLDPAEAVPGMRYKDVMEAARTPMVKSQLVSGTNSEEGARSMEAQLEDGRWLQINERRTKDGGFVSVGTDITTIKGHERKLLDSERRLMATISDLRKSRQTLEKQAQQLAEMAEKYAREKTRAESANRIKSEFLANISHELRTPLNAVIGFSEIMNAEMFGELGSDKYKEYCRDIHESGSFLLGVINDILDMSKIEAGRFSLDYETVSLNDILEESLRIMSYQAQDRGIEVIEEVAGGIKLDADRRAIKQILLNLLSNAVKFSNDGGRVFVRARRVSGCVTISIEDKGIGISRSDLRKLGRPFEQVQNQFTKSHKGSGLGLAISRSLTELHGGAMKIRSREGQGTIVSLRLPLRRGTSATCDGKKEFSVEEMKAAS
ncbi:MAG: ATP-binding protein [Rhizobiaceae bacterium]